MNKTVTMNLGGIIFHIEEDAYERLSNYLKSIKGYFKNSESSDEIMSDIEARIAEMLQEKVSTAKQAVLMSDIEDVIKIMGKPEDFADGNTESDNSQNQTKEENKHQQEYKRRRLFRDPDDKILGGVCSGIANHFDIDPIWLRGAFAVSFFIFGSGLLLYIILLLIIPKAKTTAEKLEMRGEKIDINNIGKTVTEEFEDLKKRMKNFGDDVASPKNKEKMKHSAERAGEFITDAAKYALGVLRKIFAVGLIIFGVTLMIILLASIFGADLIHINTDDYEFSYSFYDFANAFLPDSLPIELTVVGLLLFLGLPVLSMIYSGIRFLFGIKYRNKIVGYTTTILWFCGLALLIYVGVEVQNNFSESATNKETTILFPTKCDTLFLSVNKNNMYGIEENSYDNFDSQIKTDDWLILKQDNELIKLGYPKLEIEKSETDSIELVIIKTARGISQKEAAYRAKNTEYVFHQTDSLLSFEPYFNIDENNKWGNQKVKIILKLPLNKIIYLDKSMKDIIYNIENIHDIYTGDMLNRRWIMTKNGLTCMDCLGLEKYNGDSIAPPPLPPTAPLIKQ